MYENGRGVACDYEEARAWCLKAAEQGHADAQFHLGELYEIALIRLRDYEKAVVWYLKAAEQGHCRAQYRLGQMYCFGIGVQKDYVEAVAWLKKAAYKGHSPAQLLLGSIYQAGESVSQDFKEAAILFTLAAEQECIVVNERKFLQARADEVLVKLSSAERHEVDETASKWLAENWYRVAAERGYVEVQFKLGLLYERGCGVPQNYEEAYFWLHLAAARNKGRDRKQYARTRDAAAKKLTPQSLSKVLERTARWSAEHPQP
jgi:TPR repeat protein